MWQSQRVVAVIPARGGSRRLPGKNIKPIAGKPMIEWSILAAKETGFVDNILVTSDCETILEVAAKGGAQAILRPPEMARDESPTMDAIWHALEQPGAGGQIVVLLQPTSPLRTAADITQTLGLLENFGAAVTVSEKIKNPAWAYRLLSTGELRREEEQAPADGRLVCLNGAVYTARMEWLARVGNFLGEGMGGVLMPVERSVDIDLLEEFEEAEKQLLGTGN